MLSSNRKLPIIKETTFSMSPSPHCLFSCRLVFCYPLMFKQDCVSCWYSLTGEIGTFRGWFPFNVQSLIIWHYASGFLYRRRNTKTWELKQNITPCELKSYLKETQRKFENHTYFKRGKLASDLTNPLDLNAVSRLCLPKLIAGEKNGTGKNKLLSLMTIKLLGLINFKKESSERIIENPGCQRWYFCRLN